MISQAHPAWVVGCPPPQFNPWPTGPQWVPQMKCRSRVDQSPLSDCWECNTEDTPARAKEHLQIKPNTFLVREAVMNPGPWPRYILEAAGWGQSRAWPSGGTLSMLLSRDATHNVPGMEEIPSIQEYDINFMSCDSFQVNSLSLFLQN